MTNQYSGGPPAARLCVESPARLESATMDVGQILLRKGLVTEQQLAEARRNPALSQGRPMHLLLSDMGFIDELTTLEALAESLGMAFVDLASMSINPAILSEVPAKV